ncbi:putative bifunctional diguanylate cyclase/phosphodiesterase [Telluria beijingensis]|uniref:putative bifunctional diguanylate cyclase/phosphodiesterase n=1 Tax=Telluria beijingensis TaxID=3068633 RepID=UPI0027954EA1|nr:GGDEF domain-containing protein [Massilia sp. REN29]
MIYRLVRGRARRVRPGARKEVLFVGDEEVGHDVLTDPADPKLDYITRLAVQATGADIGGISLMFQSQIWLPSRIGIQDCILPRTGSFCHSALEEGVDWFEIDDASRDVRFADNPLVSQAPHYRHYAGVALKGESEHLLGTLWVMSRTPRRLDVAQAAQLRLMARIVVDMLELRYCDAVTGMFNRAVFLHHLQRMLDERPGATLSVGMVDLIGFRQVNDLFRRETGDRILRLMGKRLEDWADGALLGHLGADQFAFALVSPPHEHDACMRRLCAAIDQPFEVEQDCMHTLNARIGIRRQQAPCEESAGGLLDAADIAATAIRQQQGVSVVHEYDAALMARARLRYELREAIRGAPRFGRLEVHYQPQVDVAHGRLIGLEALVRWRHPAYGMVGPGMFVPQAESSGRIFELDIHVLELVCRDLMDWRARGLSVPPVALNFSRASLMHSQVFARLAEVLEATGVPGDLLEFEVTESQLLDSPTLLHQRISALRALGVRVAVDDFGTGYSNLDALTSFPFDRLKADRRFVHGVASDARTAGVFALIQGIAAVFDAELLCEGLEDEADLSWLAERGVHCVQGWYFSRAQPAPAIEQVLRRFQEAQAAPLSVPEMRALLA